MDTYHNFDEIKSAFSDFYDLTKKKVVINEEDIGKIWDSKEEKVITFGFTNKAKLCAKDVKEKQGKYSFDCYFENKKLFRVKLNVLGKHNIVNALACIALSLEYKIPLKKIKFGLESFQGVKRRAEVIKQGDVTFYCDYAHHPTEIKSTLSTLRLITKGRLIAIFQPHTYSRTLSLMAQFKTCFNEADCLIILPTYSAREKRIEGGDATDLFFNLDKKISSQYVSNFDALSFELNNLLKPNDICVFIGAGDIYNIALKYVERV